MASSSINILVLTSEPILCGLFVQAAKGKCVFNRTDYEFNLTIDTSSTRGEKLKFIETFLEDGKITFLPGKSEVHGIVMLYQHNSEGCHHRDGSVVILIE